MTKLLTTIAALTVLLAIASCSKGDSASTSKESNSSAENSKAQPHAAADVLPGSHEDWCGEHEVPESQCTRCNPALTAAFKATGDWCEQHGLPESQCLKCNPEIKIVRPPPSVPAETKE